MELAKIIRRYEKQLSAKKLLPQQRKALNAMARCRTPASGKMVVVCPSCSRAEHYCLSCGNRSCPKCQNFETTTWMERQRKKLLPVDYYMVTFTLPAQLRTHVWDHQKKLYDLLFKTAATALKELAKNSRFLGGDIGMTGVLHTNSRRLDFHRCTPPSPPFYRPGRGFVRRQKILAQVFFKVLDPSSRSQSALQRKIPRRVEGTGVLLS